MLTNFLKDVKTKTILGEWLHKGLLKYAAGSATNWADEDNLCGFFFGCLAGSITTPSGHFSVSHHKTIGRGPGTDEKRLGADGLLIININTSETVLQGFLLFQAKKALSESATLAPCPKEQCGTMLSHSSASYLLTLMPNMGYMTGAIAVSSHVTNVRLSEVPYVNFPRFVTEQVLHGLMLEPFESLKRSSDLRNLVKRVVVAIGTSEGGREAAAKEIEEAIAAAGLSLESKELTSQEELQSSLQPEEVYEKQSPHLGVQVCTEDRKDSTSETTCLANQSHGN